MHRYLHVRRRYLRLSYDRYVAADREWARAIEEAQSWFPREGLSEHFSMGNPGSRLRKLFEQRERALLRLQSARQKFDEARARLAVTRRPQAIRLIAFLP